MVMINHYIERELIEAGDVDYPIKYYIPRMKKHQQSINKYLNYYNLIRAREYLNKYHNWNDQSE
jgi:hypothetical protein